VHTSVLLYEAIDYLKCEKKKTIVDCTVGAAGHTKEILKRLSPDSRLIGLDQDKAILDRAKEALRDFDNKNLLLLNENFRDIDKVLRQQKIDYIDGMLFDLGVSSFQLSDAARGFSFLTEGPLDMRMDAGTGSPLSEVLRRLTEKELGEIIRDLGEEKFWRRISKAIFSEQKREPIKDSLRLANIVRKASSYKSYSKIDPATRTFQALRIYVNDELGALKETLVKAGSFLSKEARIVVISFHSLEDRIVKHTFREMAKEGILKVITKKPIRPSDQECSINPRSRSAKLRAAERI